jgi:hypothetical protein
VVAVHITGPRRQTQRDARQQFRQLRGEPGLVRGDLGVGQAQSYDPRVDGAQLPK